MFHELEVTGMTCNHCRAAVAQALAKVPGVSHVTVDLPSGRASITADEGTEVATLTAAVEAQGYSAKPAVS